MKKVEVTMDDDLWEKAAEMAKKQGRNCGKDPGIASLMRGSLRYVLNKNGYKFNEDSKKG